MAKAIFVNTFEQLRSNAISSNYYQNQSYKYFSINLVDGWDSLSYSYHVDALRTDNYNTRIDKDLIISNIHLENAETTEPLSDMSVNIHPYELSCDFGLDAMSGTDLRFDIEIKKSNIRYCFAVPSSNCKLTEIKCKEADMEDFRNEMGFDE